jgi:uncharacterized protein YndB with AHSA1/START domain
MKNEPFVIERTYNAPVSRVWKAITDRDQMKQWYFNIPEFKAEKGFEFQFYGADGDCNGYLHLCKILEVVPNKKLSHTWTYEKVPGESVVTIELFDEDGKTRLRLTHEGLETFPDTLPLFSRESFAEGWTEIIGTSLPDFVEWDTIESSIDISASSETVWQILTNPDHNHKWARAFYEGTTVSSTWQVGDTVVWYMPDGSVAANGIVLESQTAAWIKVGFYDDVNDAPPTPSGDYRETYQITKNANGCTLKITSGPLARHYLKMHTPMWGKALEYIKSLSERKVDATQS